MKTKLFKIFNKILYLISIGVLFIGVSVFAEWITNDPSLNVFGVNIYVIGSESMACVDPSNEETLKGMRAGFLQVDDVVVIKKLTARSSLSAGDIVAYKNNDGLIIVHRIADVRLVDEEILYYTRGDANNVNDPRPLKRSDIIGTFLFSIPYFGEVALFLKSKYGMYALIIATFLILLTKYISISEREKSDPLYTLRSENKNL